MWSVMTLGLVVTLAVTFVLPRLKNIHPLPLRQD
jgi:hypothetical protein